MKPKQVVELVQQAIADFGKHKAPQLAAALSYYTIFSIAPLLVITIAIAGLVFGQAAAQNQIVDQISGVVGSDAAKLIQTMIQNVNKPGTGILATIIGFVTLLGGAAGVFGQLKNSLNTIWDYQPKPGPGGIKGIVMGLRSQLLSFLMVLGTGLLLLISLVLSTVLAGLSTVLGSQMPIPAGVWELVNFAASFGVITLLFAALYKVLPDAKIAWRDVWFGAAVTSLLFTIGKWLIGLYLGHSTTASTYGAAGALVVLLLWIYYSAHILFLGAEFTQVYARKHGSLVPEKNAAPPAITSAEKHTMPSRDNKAVVAAMHNKVADEQQKQEKKRAATDGLERIIRILSPLLLVIARIVIMNDQAQGNKKRQKPKVSAKRENNPS